MSDVFQDNWRGLFAAGDGNAANALRFYVVKRGGWPFLFLPESNRAAAAALALYPAQTTKARFAKAVLRFGLKSGLRVGLDKMTVAISDHDEFSRFLAATAGTSDIALPRFAVLAGNPKAPGRRDVFMLFDSSLRPVTVVKAGGSTQARAFITHEAALLASRPQYAMGLPGVRARFSSPRVEAFAMDFILGESPEVGQPGKLHVIFSSWIDSSHRIPLGDLPAWKRLIATLDHGDLSDGIAALGKNMVHPVLMHGDFAPWNVKVADGQWTVLDWERGEVAGVPAWDWFHFIVQPAVLVARESETKTLAQLETLFSTETFQSYARLTGIAGHERALVVAYLHFCIRVTQQTEGLERINALLRLAGQSWMRR